MAHVPIPTSPSPSSSSASPRLLHSNSSEWNAVVQRNIKSSLLLLLVLSTLFVFSVLYTSRSFGSTAAEEGLTQQSTLVVSGRLVPEEEEADEPTAPAENNVAPEQSSPADISLPSGKRTGDQSKFHFTRD